MWQLINTYIIGIITALSVFIVSKIILKKEILVSKKTLFFMILIVSTLNTIIYLNLNGTIKSFLMIVVDIIFNTYIFKISLKKSLILTFVYSILSIITDLFELFFITKILHLSKEFCYDSFAGSIIGNVFIFILLIFLTWILKSFLNKLINAQIENDIKILLFSILTFISFGMFFYTLIKEFRFSDNIIMYLVAIIVLISVLFSLIKQTIDNKKLINEYDKLLEFMTTYEHEIEKQRVLRHETKNEFLTIRGKIEDNQKNKEIVDYINEILKDKIEVKQEEYAKFGYLPANGIKGLCYLKFQEAQDKGINTSINISKRIKNSNIYKIDTKQQRNLGKILGVLLDNAIEASLDSNDKKLGIEVYLINKECQIIISNSYNKNKTNKISKNKLSSKGKNRGHGLLLVKYITEHSNMFEVTTDITDELYSQKVTVKKT